VKKIGCRPALPSRRHCSVPSVVLPLPQIDATARVCYYSVVLPLPQIDATALVCYDSVVVKTDGESAGSSLA
jgi:hypothetical protein